MQGYLRIPTEAWSTTRVKAILIASLADCNLLGDNQNLDWFTDLALREELQMGFSLAHASRVVGLLVLWAAVFGTETRAELPPGSYDKLRAEAQEALTGEVLSVETKELEVGKTEVVAEMKVTAVKRSKADLKKGDTLTVKYVHIDSTKLKGFAGPRPVPILKKGETCTAFLNKKDDEETYEPAAYGESFTAPKQR